MFRVVDEDSGESKYVTRSKAKVVDNNDPLKRGRVIVDHPLLGETVWVDYLKVPGSFNVPKVGDLVYVECDVGSPNHPIVWGNVTYGPDGDTDIPEEFTRADPTNRGFYSPGGHIIEIDDGEDLSGTNQGIRLTASSGAKFGIDSQNDSITAAVVFGDSLELSAANGFQVQTPAAGGTSLSQKGGKVDISATLDSTFASSLGTMTISGSGGAKLKLGAGKVGLGSAAGELVDLFEQLLTQLDTLLTAMALETHTGNLGYPTSPPLNVASYAAVQAQIAIIKAFVTAIKGGI